MKELKFRIWNKKYKIFEYLESIFNKLDEDFDYDILNQYTGFKDKNNNKIYEGDILNYGSPKYLYFDTKSGRYLLKFNFNEKGSAFYADTTIGQSEIIGNIYQNPEIIRDKNK